MFIHNRCIYEGLSTPYLDRPTRIYFVYIYICSIETMHVYTYTHTYRIYIIYIDCIYIYTIHILVGGLEHFLFFHILGIIIATD